jgi:hypothetical protein
LRETQRSAYTDEKENILTTRTQLKLMENTVENNIELTRAQAQHRIELRQALRGQEARKAKRTKYWSGILDRDVSLKVVGVSGSTSKGTSGQSSVQGKSVGASQNQSKTASRRGSNGKISEKMQEFQQDDASKIMDGANESNLEDAADLAMMTSTELEAHQDKAKAEIQGLNVKLRTFQQSNARALADMKNKQAKLMKAKEEEAKKFMMVIESFNNSLGNGVET